jgi:isoprenylcysteine carboxyl methyltransferase (ICMT) family protein YpbQ
VNKAAINMRVPVALLNPTYIPKNGIARSYGSYNFSFLRSLHMFLHSSCTNLHSHQDFMRVAFTPHSHQYLLLFVFLMLALLTGVRWNIKVVSICNSLWPGLLNIYSVVCGHLDFFL